MVTFSVQITIIIKYTRCKLVIERVRFFHRNRRDKYKRVEMPANFVMVGTDMVRRPPNMTNRTNLSERNYICIVPNRYIIMFQPERLPTKFRFYHVHRSTMANFFISKVEITKSSYEWREVDMCDYKLLYYKYYYYYIGLHAAVSCRKNADLKRPRLFTPCDERAHDNVWGRLHCGQWRRS